MLLVLSLLPLACQRRPADSVVNTGEPELRRRADSVSDLAWTAPGLFPELQQAGTVSPAPTLQRLDILRLKRERLSEHDDEAVAKINATLSSEAFQRATAVLRLWLPRRDQETGLFPESTEAGDQRWSYRNAGADLFPHLTIAARLLMPERYNDFLDVLANERDGAKTLPDDVNLVTDQPQGMDEDDRIFGAAEYAKDGLLPLFERLGPDPWLERLVQVADAVIDKSSTKTVRGSRIPGRGTEINGDMLQVYSRLYWATGEERFYQAAEQIAIVYLEDILPKTGSIPPHSWDFAHERPNGDARFHISDHGNEIVSGLIEWHLAETFRGDPDVPRHRQAIRLMLDRLKETARSPDGMWARVIAVPSGEMLQDDLSDNWGYISQAYLTMAYLEGTAPDGDSGRAAAYRQVVQDTLNALPRYRYEPWEEKKMDGYADATESAIYLLHEVDSPGVEGWVDDQVSVLFGFQDGDGRVLDGYLDGNFIRTSLLYGYFLTQGARLTPWTPDVLIGAERTGDCLSLWLMSQSDWEGRLVLDTPRHRLYGRLPVDYPRLNEWPEWFTVEDGQHYALTDQDTGASATVDGSSLSSGLPLQLSSGSKRSLQICATQ